MKTRIMSMVWLGLGLALGVALSSRGPAPAGLITSSAQAQRIAGGPSPEFLRLRGEVEALKLRAADQSHVMADVGDHFANLWFAGENKNWPLAKYYFDETRAHIQWAVRVIPLRKDSSAGRDVDLRTLWQALDTNAFSQINSAIEGKDTAKFAAAYRQGLDGCYGCHKSAGKPYLRPQIPKVPPQPIINFDPAADWPQ